MAFFLKKTFDLSEYGWEDCQIVFQSLAYSEIQDIQSKIQSVKGEPNTDLEKELINFMCEKLINGQGLNEKGEKEQITKENFKQLPFEIVVDLAYKLSGGGVDPSLKAL